MSTVNPFKNSDKNKNEKKTHEKIKTKQKEKTKDEGKINSEGKNILFNGYKNNSKRKREETEESKRFTKVKVQIKIPAKTSTISFEYIEGPLYNGIDSSEKIGQLNFYGKMERLGIFSTLLIGKTRVTISGYCRLHNKGFLGFGAPCCKHHGADNNIAVSAFTYLTDNKTPVNLTRENACKVIHYLTKKDVLSKEEEKTAIECITQIKNEIQQESGSEQNVQTQNSSSSSNSNSNSSSNSNSNAEPADMEPVTKKRKKLFKI